MPWVFNNVRVLDLYFRSSLRMSSVRMKTKLGLTGGRLGRFRKTARNGQNE